MIQLGALHTLSLFQFVQISDAIRSYDRRVEINTYLFCTPCFAVLHTVINWIQIRRIWEPQ